MALLCLPRAGDAAQGELEFRRIESALLHRQIDLGPVRLWQHGRFVPQAPRPGRLLVLHLWAVECRPCVSEMPLLRNIARAFHKDPAVQFAFVSETLDEAQLGAFLRQREAELPERDVYQRGDDRVRKVLQSTLQPITLLLDRGLVVRHAFVGSLGGRRNELIEAIERLARAAR